MWRTEDEWSGNVCVGRRITSGAKDGHVVLLPMKKLLNDEQRTSWDGSIVRARMDQGWVHKSWRGGRLKRPEGRHRINVLERINLWCLMDASPFWSTGRCEQNEDGEWSRWTMWCYREIKKLRVKTMERMARPRWNESRWQLEFGKGH